MSRSRFIGYGRQLIEDDDVAAVERVLRSDYLTQGPAVEQFEQAFADRVGARHAVAVANGSAALHVACLAGGIGPGSHVLVPNITFVATANAVTASGGHVILADIDQEGLGLAPAMVAGYIEQQPEITAIMPVHFAGLAGDMAVLRRAAAGRLVIEDAAHALGGYYPDGKPVGCCAYSDMACFSFHPVKPITAGEGGAVTTNDGELARRLRLFRNHGIEREALHWTTARSETGPWFYEQQALGYNYRLSDIHAALAQSQLAKLDRFVDRRRAIAARYDAAFGRHGNICPVQRRPDQRRNSAHHLYVVTIEFTSHAPSRGQVMEALRRRGIGSQVHYIPLARQPFYQALLGEVPASYPRSEAYYAAALSLPIHAGMTDAEVDYVIASLSDVIDTPWMAAARDL